MAITVGIIKNEICIDISVFDDFETAQKFFDMGVWDNIEADGIAELPEGFGIEDSFICREWVKKALPIEEQLTILEEELDFAILNENLDIIAELQAKVSELKESTSF